MSTCAAISRDNLQNYKMMKTPRLKNDDDIRQEADVDLSYIRILYRFIEIAKKK